MHDVAPATFDDCANTLTFLDDLGLGPVALLVVPDYQGRTGRDDRLASFIASRILRGDEIVLHGHRHTDTAARQCVLREWLVRRVYTESEGEFSRLDFEMARTGILRGLVVLRSAGWHPTGFVAPAWMWNQALLAHHATSRVVRVALHPAASRSWLGTFPDGMSHALSRQ